MKDSLGFWIAIGVGVGTGIGVATKNIKIGISIGVALGIVMNAYYKRKNNQDTNYFAKSNQNYSSQS